MQTLLTTLALAPFLATGMAGEPEFKAPVEVLAGGNDFSGVLYPSPVFHDINGDGRHELVIGDLRGYLEYATRLSAGDEGEWGEMTKLQATDGKDIKFSNW